MSELSFEYIKKSKDISGVSVETWNVQTPKGITVLQVIRPTGSLKDFIEHFRGYPTAKAGGALGDFR